jgi:hypothetical protein
VRVVNVCTGGDVKVAEFLVSVVSGSGAKYFRLFLYRAFHEVPIGLRSVVAVILPNG